MNSTFVSEHIIKIIDGDIFNDDDSDTIKLISKLGICLKHSDFDNAHNMFKSVNEKIETENDLSIRQKYGLTDDVVNENHEQIDNIQNDMENMRLFNSHGYTNTLVGHIRPLLFTTEEMKVLEEIYKSDDNALLVLVRKTNENKTRINFLKYDDDKKYLRSIDFHLTFYIFDDNDKDKAKKSLLFEIFNNLIEKLNYDTPDYKLYIGVGVLYFIYYLIFG